MSEEDVIRRLRFEMVKSDILSKLNLKEPPTPPESSQRPSVEMIKLLLNETEQISTTPAPSQTEKEQRMLFYAHNSDYHCMTMNETYCSRFEFDLTPDLNSQSAEVWIYRPDASTSQELSVSVFINSAENENNFHGREFFDAGYQVGWNRFELSSLEGVETENDTLLCAIEVNGSKVEEEGEWRPFLSVIKGPTVAEKSRRGLINNTTKGQSYMCYLAPFRVTFADLGWSNFIIYPEYYDANICMGQCERDRSNFKTFYVNVMTSLYELNATLAQSLGSCWAPCCRPRDMKSLRIFYIDNNGTICDINLKDMIAETCACF